MSSYLQGGGGRRDRQPRGDVQGSRAGGKQQPAAARSGDQDAEAGSLQLHSRAPRRVLLHCLSCRGHRCPDGQRCRHGCPQNAPQPAIRQVFKLPKRRKIDEMKGGGPRIVERRWTASGARPHGGGWRAGPFGCTSAWPPRTPQLPFRFSDDNVATMTPGQPGGAALRRSWQARRILSVQHHRNGQESQHQQSIRGPAYMVLLKRRPGAFNACVGRKTRRRMQEVATLIPWGAARAANACEAA